MPKITGHNPTPKTHRLSNPEIEQAGKAAETARLKGAKTTDQKIRDAFEPGTYNKAGYEKLGQPPPAKIAPEIADAYRTPSNLVALSGSSGFLPVEVPTKERLAGSVPVKFEAGRGTPDAKLAAGGKMALSYDPGRSSLTGSANGMPSYGVTAFIRLEPSGKVIEKPAVAFEQTPSRLLAMPNAVPVVVDLPPGTTGVSVWFRQFAAGDQAPRESWDSNYGNNYHFDVQ